MLLALVFTQTKNVLLLKIPLVISKMPYLAHIARRNGCRCFGVTHPDNNYSTVSGTASEVEPWELLHFNDANFIFPFTIVSS